MKKAILSVFFALITFACTAQTPFQLAFDSAQARYTESDYAAALPLAKQALLYAEQNGKDSSYANALILFANTRAEFGELVEAEAQLREAIELRRRLFGENHPGYAAALENLAVFHYFFSSGKEAEMEDLYTRALRIVEKNPGKKSREYSEIANALGELYRILGRYEESYQLFNEALAIRERIFGTQHPKYGGSLNNLAVLNFSMGRVEEAEALFARALEIDKTHYGADHLQYANGLNNLATLYSALNKYDQAEALLLESLEICKKRLGETSVEYLTSLANLASIYLYSGRYELAEKTYLKVLPHLKNNASDYARELNNLSVAYQYMSKYDLSEKYLLESLDLKAKTQGKKTLSYSSNLNNLAFIYRDKKDYAAAERVTLEALDIVEQIAGKRHPNFLLFKSNLGGIYLFSNQLEKSERCLLESISANAADSSLLQIGDTTWFNRLEKAHFYNPEYLLNALQYLQLVWHRTAPEQAHRLSLSIASLNEQFRKAFSSEKDKLSFLKQTSKTAAQSLAISQQLFQQSSQDRYIRDAFLFAEQNKSVVLADATRSQRARSMSDLPDSLAIKELNLQEELGQYERQRLDLMRIDKNKRNAEQESQLQQVLAAINRLNFEANALKQTLEKNYPRYYQLKYSNNLTKLEEIQALLSEKTVLLEYFVADTVVYIFSIHKNKALLYTRPIHQKQLAEKTAHLRRTLSDYSFIETHEKAAKALFIETSHWFYRELVAPVLVEYAGIDRLIIVPDNSLAHLPFEVFLTQAATEEMPYSAMDYLIKQYTISYNYSAGLLKEAHQRPASQNNRQLLAYAPRYGDISDSLTSARRSPYTTNLRKILAPLPQAKEEVLQLSKPFRGTFRTDDLANERNFKAEASDYAVLHLAMHGLLNKKTPMISSLAFSENGDSIEDNFLEAWEIAHLKLNADLVVLSACETGYGTFEQGEGVLSLARSFLFAGVPSLVVSMWEVNDASTSIIMQQFYQSLAQGQDKAQALRQAKLQYLSDQTGRAAHPAYWSAFIQLGDERPISIETKGLSWLFWASIAGGLAFLLFFLFRMRRKA